MATNGTDTSADRLAYRLSRTVEPRGGGDARSAASRSHRRRADARRGPRRCRGLEPRRLGWAAQLGLGLLALACGDPVRAEQIDALGPEEPGVEPGALHRPGQPCLVCHSPGGKDVSTFSLAGTVYQRSDSLVPLQRAIVRFVDAEGGARGVYTNCAGNFFVRTEDWVPVFPVRVHLAFANLKVEMRTRIHRDGSCAGCHDDPPRRDSAGHVYFSNDALDYPPPVCLGDEGGD